MHLIKAAACPPRRCSNLINGFGLNVFNPDVLKDQVDR